jgi:NADH-quinone oxidoreductase subunit D
VFVCCCLFCLFSCCRVGVEVNYGPSHPAAHGVFRGLVWLKVECVVRWVSFTGLLHRCVEKLMACRAAFSSVGLMDRLDYVSTLASESVYSGAIEDSLSIILGSLSQFLRCLTNELSRLLNHCLNIGCHSGDLGCICSCVWLFEDRELLYNLCSRITGSRLHVGDLLVRSYICTSFLWDWRPKVCRRPFRKVLRYFMMFS